MAQIALYDVTEALEKTFWFRLAVIGGQESSVQTPRSREVKKSGGFISCGSATQEWLPHRPRCCRMPARDDGEIPTSGTIPAWVFPRGGKCSVLGLAYVRTECLLDAAYCSSCSS